MKFGPFTLELVNVADNKAFPEHKQNNKAYAEVEPGTEYKIRLTSNRDKDAIVRLYLDNSPKRLLSPSLRARDSKDVSSYIVQIDDEEKEFTLQFADTEKRPAKINIGGNAWTGKIKAIFWHKTYTKPEPYTKTVKGESSGWSGGTVAESQTQTKSKGAKTIPGREISSRRVEVGKIIKGKRNWKQGRYLGTITLHYCTTMGLIDAGILPRCEYDWAMARKYHPYTGSSTNVPDVDPEEYEIDVDPDLPKKKVTKYDFSGLPSSDEDEKVAASDEHEEVAIQQEELSPSNQDEEVAIKQEDLPPSNQDEEVAIKQEDLPPSNQDEEVAIKQED